MAMTNEEFHEIVKKLPDEKLKKLKEYAEKLSLQKDRSFENGMDYLFDNYDKTLERLKDR